MRHAQLITYGLEDPTAEPLQKLAQDLGVALRVTRNAKSCLNLLRQGAAGVLLLRVGRHLETEFSLLAQATQQFPHVETIVWADADHPRLAGLAWDLGARAVSASGPDDEGLRDMIRRLLPE